MFKMVHFTIQIYICITDFRIKFEYSGKFYSRSAKDDVQSVIDILPENNETYFPISLAFSLAEKKKLKRSMTPADTGKCSCSTDLFGELVLNSTVVIKKSDGSSPPRMMTMMLLQHSW